MTTTELTRVKQLEAALEAAIAALRFADEALQRAGYQASALHCVRAAIAADVELEDGK